MTHDELLAKVDAAWQPVLTLLGRVPLDAMQQPSGIGDWRMQDVVGHLASWEEDLLDYLAWVQRGERRPKLSDTPGWDMDAHNATLIAAKATAPALRLLIDLGATHQRLVAAIAALPGEAVADESVVDKIGSDTWWHYEEHQANLQAWLTARRLA